MKTVYVLISFLVGLLSLGEEIVWVRVVGFLSHSVPQAFSFVLFLYISGIAVGAYWGPRLLSLGCSVNKIVSLIFMSSGAIVYISPWAINFCSGEFYAIFFIAVLIFSGAALKGSLFPLLHQWYSEKGEKLGRTLSHVYVANVFGSALGPLLVGFFLLNILPSFSVLALLGAIEFFVGFFIFLRHRVYVFSVSLVMALGVIIFTYPATFYQLKDITEQAFEQPATVSHVIENRHGIIFSVKLDGQKEELVYGGNVYDGSFNVSLSENTNGIDRVFLLGALHQKYERILVVGLSTGSWLRVLSSFPGVKKIDVVEINSGYKQLIDYHQPNNQIFKDSRISIHYTDGRKFINKNVAGNYDLIVMNTTWYWRAYSTNLLSKEFFLILKNSLNKDGLFAFNSTGSIDAIHTASAVFSYSYSYKNFVISSEHDFIGELGEGADRLCQFDAAKINGQNCGQVAYKNAVSKLVNIEIMSSAQRVSLNAVRAAELITDDNMISEYKYGEAFSM